VRAFDAQWHRCPLDPRNNDVSGFLRRSGINAPDSAGDRRPPEGDDDLELYSVLLCGLRKDMLETRMFIWNFMQQRVAQLFFSMCNARGASLQVRRRACRSHRRCRSRRYHDHDHPPISSRRRCPRIYCRGPSALYHHGDAWEP
jgi:hypothetical protein